MRRTLKYTSFCLDFRIQNHFILVFPFRVHMTRIESLAARQILDSRGNPTVEAEIRTELGDFIARVPSGASTGVHEALELRDGGKVFGGKGVLKAVANINGPIARKLKGRLVASQLGMDEELCRMDGTPNKSKLGANAILAVSMAVCRAGAAANEQELFEYIGELAQNRRFVLPVPQLNVLNGGRHAGIENDIQEHMLVPHRAKSFSEALRMGVESYHALKKELFARFGVSATLLGDEGGFVPAELKTVEARLSLMQEVLSNQGFSKSVSLALDCAASEFFESGQYALYHQHLYPGQMVDFYSELVRQFDLVSLEDGLAEDDWTNWTSLTSELGSKTQIVGDDLLVSNPERIRKAIAEKACNALLLKLNQIGTVSESISAFRLAKKAGWHTVVSNRSGETEDSFIADLAVGLGCGQCKFGAPARAERTAKYNRLLSIEESLGKKAKFAELK